MAESEEVKLEAAPAPMTDEQFERYVRIACWMIGWRLAGLIGIACVFITGDQTTRLGIGALAAIAFLFMCLDDCFKMITRSKSMRSFS